MECKKGSLFPSIHNQSTLEENMEFGDRKSSAHGKYL